MPRNPSNSPTFDPFAPGFDAWPYDQYRNLREHDPVHWSDLLCGWVLTRYDDVARILRDKTVSSDLARAKPSAVVDLLRGRQRAQPREGTTLVLSDDPAHARLRKALQAPFTARAIEQLRVTIAQRVDEALEAVAGRTEMNLIADFAYPLPVTIFCELLGIPAEAGPRFRRWTAAVARSLDLVISETDYDVCMAEIVEMEAYLGELAAYKQAHPADDVLTQLVRHAGDDGPLTHDELIAQLITLYVAGHEPTTALIGNGMAALFAHPDQLTRLQANPHLVPATVLELLRYDGPNQFVRRVVVEPLMFGEHAIPAGDVIYVGVGAANHDPIRWGPDADVLRIDRPDVVQHLQFGGGIHHCLGAHLARAQAEIALAALLRQLPNLRPAGDVTWSGRMTLRSAAEVPIAFG